MTDEIDDEETREVKRILAELRGGTRAFDPVAFAEQAKQQVLRQDSVIDEIAEELATKIAAPHKTQPIASFLFLGKTGVGKTELGKAIAKLVMPKGIMIHKTFNSTTRPEDTLAHLVGDRAVYKNPKVGEITRITPSAGGVIFLDEIDKIPKEHNTLDFLLTPLSEGYVVEEYQGRKIDVRRTIWILAANWEAEALSDIVKAEPNSEIRARRVRDLMRANNYLRPEILGRISRIFIFNPLDTDNDRIVIFKHMIQMLSREFGFEVKWIDPHLIGKCLHNFEVNSDKGVRGMDGDVRGLFSRSLVRARREFGLEAHDDTVLFAIDLVFDPYSSDPIIRPAEGGDRPSAEIDEEAEAATEAAPRPRRKPGAGKSRSPRDVP